MTLLQIEERVHVLEKTVRRLTKAKAEDRKWYRTHAGRFSKDPVFEEIIKLGHAYRASQRPAANSKRA